jgi:hypothetical protein
MIIERSPTPQVLEERPIEELSVEELRERLRRQEVCHVLITAVRQTHI